MFPPLRGRRTASVEPASPTPPQPLTPRELDACLAFFQVPARKLAPNLKLWIARKAPVKDSTVAARERLLAIDGFVAAAKLESTARTVQHSWDAFDRQLGLTPGLVEDGLRASVEALKHFPLDELLGMLPRPTQPDAAQRLTLELALDLQRNGRIELLEQSIQALKHPRRQDLRTLIECRLEDANVYLQHFKELEAAFRR